MSNYLEQRRKHIEAGRPLPEKKKYSIPKVSKKRQEKLDEQKKTREVSGETQKEKWFNSRRKELVGVCQCGCGRKSSKHEDNHFRSSCCHILPQRLFPSVALHPLNCVERNFWDGCHANMDNRSMDLWPNMADWDDIREKFFVLSSLLTDEERSQKFYSHLEKLIYAK
jgi:hypothetical protein